MPRRTFVFSCFFYLSSDENDFTNYVKAKLNDLKFGTQKLQTADGKV